MPAIVELPGASRANAYLIPAEQLEQKEDSRKWSDLDVESLALDISERGQLMPVLVTWDRPPLGKERLVIVAGRRRVAAIRYINERNLPGAPMKVLCMHFKGAETFGAATVENVKRKALSPIDLAHTIVTFEQQGKPRKEIAKILDISEPLISRTLKLLKLPISKQRDVHTGKISAENGYELADMAPEDREKVPGYAEARRPVRTRENGPAAPTFQPAPSRETAQSSQREQQTEPESAPSSQFEPPPDAEPAETSQPEPKVTRAAIRKVKREKVERGEETAGPIGRSRKEIREIFAAYATCEDGTIEEPIRKCCATIVSCIDGEVGFRAVLNRMRELKEGD